MPQRPIDPAWNRISRPAQGSALERSFAEGLSDGFLDDVELADEGDEEDLTNAEEPD